MRSQSATPTYEFATATALTLEAALDGGRLTSDGGLPWLAEAEAATGICAALAAGVPEWRHGPVRHSLVALVRQRHQGVAHGPCRPRSGTPAGQGAAQGPVFTASASASQGSPQ